MPPVHQRRHAGSVHAPARATWIGGHGTDPYEQNTQQSPGFGFRVAPQVMHAKK